MGKMTVDRPDLLRIALAPARWVERARGRRRTLLIALYVVIATVLGSLVYRQARLAGLPDVGDPFDTAPLLSLRVADEGNAFVFFRQARAGSVHNREVELRLLNSPYAWPAEDDAEALDYLARNEEALQLWKRGTECPDALERPIGELTFESMLPDIQEHRHFVRLASLHVSRELARGDAAAAWDWLRAILRGSRLVGRNGIAIAGLVGVAEYSVGSNLAKRWGADPGVDAPLLRRALAEVEEINDLTAPPSSGLRVEYLSTMKSIADADKVDTFLLENPYTDSPFDRVAWYNHWPAYRGVRRFLTHEPERTRRLLRLAYANWLTHCDDPPGERPQIVGPADLVTPPPQGPRTAFWFFDETPPAGPAPRALAARMEATPLAASLLIAYPAFQKAYDRDRSQRIGLVMSLAEEVFRREQGRDPESPRELIGAVLERFPDGYTPPD
jgi:hypothetical protein